MTKGSSYP